ncbi:MAG: hypothetical protein Q4A15_12590 [Prevotellaceae bacterium]|nr:hypothetical protein [Prevotellaceae bacterium]
MIKKLFAVSLVALLVFSFAFAEVDVKQFSDDELLNLRDAIQNEIVERKLGTILQPGYYVVGSGLDAGNYKITALEKASIVVFSSVEQADRNKSPITFGHIPEGMTINCDLSEGFVVKLSGSVLLQQ